MCKIGNGDCCSFGLDIRVEKEQTINCHPLQNILLTYTYFSSAPKRKTPPFVYISNFNRNAVARIAEKTKTSLNAELCFAILNDARSRAVGLFAFGWVLTTSKSYNPNNNNIIIIKKDP
jgi:hypothetical protein